MKLQVAIDRVDMPRAKAIVEQVSDVTDIIEIGTSLTKEYGLRALREITALMTRTSAEGGPALLADIKTCDEGGYEFDLGYACGFGYLTVMGSSSLGTLEACASSAASHGGVMMIDLLECDDARIERISGFPDAVYCLHTSVDAQTNADPVEQVRVFRERFPMIRRIAVAGGIGRAQLPGFREAGVEIAIMGSAITKSNDIAAAARACKAAMD